MSINLLQYLVNFSFLSALLNLIIIIGYLSKVNATVVPSEVINQIQGARLNRSSPFNELFHSFISVLPFLDKQEFIQLHSPSL